MIPLEVEANVESAFEDVTVVIDNEALVASCDVTLLGAIGCEAEAEVMSAFVGVTIKIIDDEAG